MPSQQSKGKHIVVIGAGVIGLQTAISLLEAGYAVSVIAKHVPGDKSIDYTSPWAGAQWRTHATLADKELQEWDLESYNRWFDILDKERIDVSQKTGIAKFHSIFYWTDPDPAEIPTGPSSAWFAPHMRSFREVPSSDLPPGTLYGCTYDSLTIDTPIYLAYLATRLHDLGGTLIQASLPTNKGLYHALGTTLPRLLHAYSSPTASHPPTPAAVINATGLLARPLVPDAAVHPIRGQTILVRGVARHLTTVWRADGVFYAIPRAVSGATVLGGTRVAHDWRAEPDARTTGEILAQARGWAPELLTGERGEFEVLGVNVGFRPGREGGPRVEVEVLRGDGDGEGGKEVVVCHAYGHAGAGYQNSFGSAGKVVRLLGEFFERQEREKNERAKL